MAEKREGWLSPEEEREHAREIRAKQDRGETLTREEAGFLGALASRESVQEERERAEREGRGEAFREEHRVESWTTDPEKSRAPTLGEDDRRREREIRAKQERGETLTREEAGFLGGVARVREAGEE